MAAPAFHAVTRKKESSKVELSMWKWEEISWVPLRRAVELMPTRKVTIDAVIVVDHFFEMGH